MPGNRNNTFADDSEKSLDAAAPSPVYPLELTATDATGKVKEITEILEAGVKELFESERYQNYLRAMSKFHNYSINNMLLILMQKPDASMVAGYTSWKKDFGRHVKEHEKGIKILAPSPYKIRKKVKKLDSDGKPITDEAGKPVMEQEEITIPSFRVVSVFDVSQTDGKEIPNIGVETLSGSVEHYEDFFKALEMTLPVPVGFEKIESGAHGYYHLQDKRIALNVGESELQTVKTLIHEIAHAKLHDIDLDASQDIPQERPSRRTREVEAESVAYTVCQHFGLDTSDYSFGYIAGWSSGKETKELKASLETIRQTAREIITEVADRFAQIQQQRAASQKENPVMESLDTEQQQAIQGEVQATLQMLADTDRQVYSEISAETMEAADTQGYAYADGHFTKTEQHTEAEPVAEKPEPDDPAPAILTDLQKKAAEIAKKYESLSMQGKIDIIAQAFGSTTGKIVTSPCSGKWRGTSDISIQFDNGASLFIGNHRTPQARTKKIQSEYVDSVLVRYNPEIISAAKEAAIAPLMKREALDNEIAAQKGLKPYTLLGVEFNDGTNEKTQGYMGWYYVTLAVDGKICSHLETGLNFDIARGKVSEAITRDQYFVAGALRENEVDYVFNNVGHSSTAGLYSLDISDAVRERAEMTLAQRQSQQPQQEQESQHWNGMDGLINDKPFMPDATPNEQANALIDHAERDGQRMGNAERALIIRYHEAVQDLPKTVALINELCEQGFEQQHGHLNYLVKERINAEITAVEQEQRQHEPLPPSLDPAVQPVVTIIWSESEKIQDGDKLPLARADALFKALDVERRTEREKPGYDGSWYDKTRFRIDFTFHGETDSYEGRQDFGDGDGSLIDHIEAHHEYYSKNESYRNSVIHNEGMEAWEQEQAERQMILAEFVPYMRLHCNLYEQEQTAVQMLESGTLLTPEQTSYFNAVLSHVDTCRKMINAGDYQLPDPPQFSDFTQDKEIEAYKDHVREEIAQEAAAAGMTVEEYAANDYEPRKLSQVEAAPKKDVELPEEKKERPSVLADLKQKANQVAPPMQKGKKRSEVEL